MSMEILESLLQRSVCSAFGDRVLASGVSGHRDVRNRMDEAPSEATRKGGEGRPPVNGGAVHHCLHHGLHLGRNQNPLE